MAFFPNPILCTMILCINSNFIKYMNSIITNFRVAAGIGIFLTFIGGLIRLLTAIPGISENMDKDTQFWLCFTAQLFSGTYIFYTLQY